MPDVGSLSDVNADSTQIEIVILERAVNMLRLRVVLRQDFNPRDFV